MREKCISQIPYILNKVEIEICDTIPSDIPSAITMQIFTKICKYLIPKMHNRSGNILVNVALRFLHKYFFAYRDLV